MPDSPAAAAGLTGGDRITAVDGESTKGWTPDRVSARTTGAVGTPVEVTFERAGVATPIKDRMIRSRVHVPSVPYAVMLDAHTWVQEQMASEREEFHLGARFAEVVDSERILLRLHADPHPNVRVPIDMAVEFEEAVGPLGKDLELVPMSPAHHVEGAQDVFKRNILMEQVTHRVDEDALRFFPTKR